jgi:ABC-2 type transport system ATP-binding protein
MNERDFSDKDDIIEVQNLTKIFNGSVRAVEGIAFNVKAGEIFGFLGPNGAGKTTTILMLCTLLKPTEGTAKLCRQDIVQEPDMVRSCIGYAPQDISVDEDLTGLENLKLHATLYHMPRSLAEKRMAEVLQLVDLEDAKDRLVETYSGGMRKRLEIAEGLLHRPRILFLDEPTLGLDLQTRANIWEYIKRLNNEYGVTIFLTTHYMEEADMLCDRIAIMDYGKIVCIGTGSDLKDQVGGDVIEVKLSQTSPVKEQAAKALKEQPFVKDVMVSPDKLSLNVFVDRGETATPKLAGFLSEAGLVADSISMLRPSLDDVFLKYTGRRIREDKASREEFWRMRRALGRARA